jgi:SAM-dependent methyltransferase
VFESSKTLRLLTPGERALLAGRGIDIGCGPDPVLPDALPFDQEDGDANEITRFVQGPFDYVYSSHCLEHMRDARAAILEWWKLVRVGGHLIFVVPDEDLYEQGVFPSRFNGDHKATFTLSKQESWSPVSINVLDLAQGLPGGSLVALRLQDHGYDRRLQRHGPRRPGPVARPVLSLYRRLRKAGFRWMPLEALEAHCTLVDQTLGPDAVAQILCIVKKSF